MATCCLDQGVTRFGMFGGGVPCYVDMHNYRAVAMALISLTYARFDTASSVQSIVSALLLVLFLIYLNNEFAILSRFWRREASHG